MTYLCRDGELWFTPGPNLIKSKIHRYRQRRVGLFFPHPTSPSYALVINRAPSMALWLLVSALNSYIKCSVFSEQHPAGRLYRCYWLNTLQSSKSQRPSALFLFYGWHCIGFSIRNLQFLTLLLPENHQNTTRNCLIILAVGLAETDVWTHFFQAYFKYNTELLYPH